MGKHHYYLNTFEIYFTSSNQMRSISSLFKTLVIRFISCNYEDNNITFMILKILTRPNLQTFAQQTTWSLQYHNCRNWKPWHPILSFQLVDVLRHSLLPRKIHLWKKNGYANISISMNKCKYLEFQSFVFEKWKNQ